MANDANAPRVLDGIRVVDFTRIMAGPYATMMLADHGADVVKVEGLPGGDAARQFGLDYVGDQSAVYLMWNRNKRSVALDLRSAEAKAIVHRLIAQADVVVENYRPGVAEKIGFGYDELSRVNPRLVYCSISAFGSSGPMADLPGTDPVVQAASGIMSVTGAGDGDPSLVGVPIADFTGAMTAVQGVLLALLARERTGRGQRVEVSMLHALLASLTTRLATFWTTGVNPPRTGSAHSVIVPYQVFRTKDGDVMAGAWRAESWDSFCEAMELPELATDARFGTNIDRQAHRAVLMPILQAAFEQRTTAEWEQRFRDAGALFARVNTFSDIFGHPHVRESGIVQRLQHPTLGELPALAPPAVLSDTPATLATAAPLLGQHTREILAEAGCSEAEIDDLHARGIARTTVP